MHKSITILISCILLFTLVACNEAPDTAAGKSDTSVQVEEIKVFEDLKAMFSADKVVIADVKAKYEEMIQAKVIAINPEIDENISLTLQLAIDGALSADQAKQAVDKGLQWYFYNQITTLTKETAKTALVDGDIAAAKVALDQAIVLYQGSLQSTASKRDTYYAEYGIITQDLLDNTIIPGLTTAVDKGDVLSYNLSRQMLDKTFIKIFHLAAIKYAVSAPLQSDLAKAKTEVTEGYFFYMPIYNSLKGGSAEDADVILTAFASGDPSKLNSHIINNAFIAAIHGKITGYMNETIDVDMAEGDLETAQEHAMEGNMFVAILEVLIKKQLGNETYTTIQNAGAAYMAAVQAGDITAAKKHSSEILEIISSLKDI
ncbi:MAG: hypothetical protein WD424_07960 [Paenibacillaceae bacterium]